MRSMGIPSRVASEMDRVVGQAYQAILGVGDLTVAQAKQLFIPMREGGFGLASAELQAEPAMMASWASCAARVTARIGLGGIDDLTAEIPGLRSALSKLQAIRREAGEDPNDLTRLGSTATSQLALALSRVNKATRDLRDHIGANSRQLVALDSASGPGASRCLQLPTSTPIVHNSAFQHAARMRLCRPVCDHGNRCKNKKRDGTECGVALDRDGKHATTCPCGHALSARHNALRDEIANIARRTGLSADIEVLVDHPAIDPENGARMDVRISKPGVQNADKLIDVQVTSPFCVEAAGQVGKAAPSREQETNTIQTRHPRDSRPYWSHSQSVPGQDRTRRSASPGLLAARSHEAHFMCPSDPQRAHHRQMQRHHLTPSPAWPSGRRARSLAHVVLVFRLAW